MSIATAFKGEVMLAGWSETHNGGAKLTFWLPDASELDAFRALTVRKGNTAGQRFMAVLVQIGDDELPIPAEDHRPDGDSLASLARSAGMLCADPMFWLWASESFDSPVRSDKDAAELVRAGCNVDSRKQLDHYDFAAELFREKFVKPYTAWRRYRGGQ